MTNTRGICSLMFATNFILVPVAKGVAALVGLVARRWWSSRNEEEKTEYREKAMNNRNALATGAVTAVGLFSGAVWHNVERDPITDKLVLCMYNDRSIDAFYAELDALLLSTGVLRRISRDTMRATWIHERLTRANSHLAAVQNRKWTVVTENDARVNAFSMPNGVVYVTSGMMDSVNDDQLTIVIGHEMAHVVLRHLNRSWSVHALLEMGRAVVFLAAWTLLPAFPAIFASLSVHYASAFLVELPYLRHQEYEADRVGFMMAARACVDLAQGPKLWTQWAEEEGMKYVAQSWMAVMSTHPSHRSRAYKLEQLMAEARAQQELANC